MKLVSMKLSKSEAKEDLEPSLPEPPKYPYGLCLHLDETQLEKLGIDDPDVGTEVTISAKGVVTSYRESQRQGNEPDCSAEIQITDLMVEEAPGKRRARQTAKHLDRVSGRY